MLRTIESMAAAYKLGSRVVKENGLNDKNMSQFYDTSFLNISLEISHDKFKSHQ